MSDPIRWRAPDGGGPSEARELLRHARAPQALDAASRARNAAAITKIAAGPVVTSTLTAGTKLLIGIASVVAMTVAASAVRTHPSPAPRAAVVARADRPSPAAPQPVLDTNSPRVSPQPVLDTNPPRVSPPPVVSEPAAPTVTASPAAPTRRDAPRPLAPAHAPLRVTGSIAAHAPSVETHPAEPAPIALPPQPQLVSSSTGIVGAPSGPHVIPSAAAPPDTLNLQMGLLNLATSMIDSNPREALAQLDRHASEFPDAQTAPDREFLAVRVLRRLGRDDEARARGVAFLTSFPRSPYRPQVRRMFNLP